MPLCPRRQSLSDAEIISSIYRTKNNILASLEKKKVVVAITFIFINISE